MSAMHKLSLRLLLAGALVGTLLALLVFPAAAGGASHQTVTVVARHLNSPRGLVLLGDGSFLEAEAGKGGSGPCGEGPLGNMCVGRTGAATHIVAGHLDRLARPSSIALPDGSFAFGPADIAPGGHGSVWVTVGLGGTTEMRKQFGRPGHLLGHLLRVSSTGSIQDVADLAAYEKAHNPDGGAKLESDPYGILRVGLGSVVTDAGGNSLLRVSHWGHISTLAVFPQRMVWYQGQKVPMDAVPTAVVRGPDGAYYVSELTGFPYPVHGARVYRVVPGHAPEIYAKGFTNIIDIAFDGSGNLYVLEIAHNSLKADTPYGALLRVNSDGSKTMILDKGLSFPTSLALQGSHRVFLTNCGVCPGGGQVLRVDF
jgi:hypothetical protein